MNDKTPRRANREMEATSVHVQIHLSNHTYRQYSWTTPVPFGRCLSKGMSWAKRELHDEGVRGRSQIESVTVTIRRTGRTFVRSAKTKALR